MIHTSLSLSQLIPAELVVDPGIQDIPVSGVKIDSRAIQSGDVFVAIQGAQHDGHDFIDSAIQNGAVAIIASKNVCCDVPVIQVVDTHKTLQHMAITHRQMFDIPIAAITGSSGKTSTKECLAAICKQHGSTLSTKGNYNNLYGLPLSMLRLAHSHQYGVFEVGASYVGEIQQLADILRPDFALITNAGPSHIAHMGGSIDAVATEKGALYAALGSAGCAILNADDDYCDYWKGLIGGRRCVQFTMEMERYHALCQDIAQVVLSVSDMSVNANGSVFSLHTPDGVGTVQLPLLGLHNIQNALAAAATAYAMDVPLQAIIDGLSNCVGAPGRLSVVTVDSGKCLIDDTYNANPISFRAAIDVLVGKTGATCLVMGDMAELANDAERYHREIGLYAKQAGVDMLYCCGPISRVAAESFGAGAYWFDDKVLLLEDLLARLPEMYTVLVKGSRFMGMEQCVSVLKENL